MRSSTRPLCRTLGRLIPLLMNTGCCCCLLPLALVCISGYTLSRYHRNEWHWSRFLNATRSLTSPKLRSLNSGRRDRYCSWLDQRKYCQLMHKASDISLFYLCVFTLYSSIHTLASLKELWAMVSCPPGEPYGRLFLKMWPTLEHGTINSWPPHIQIWNTHTWTCFSVTGSDITLILNFFSHFSYVIREHMCLLTNHH